MDERDKHILILSIFFLSTHKPCDIVWCIVNVGSLYCTERQLAQMLRTFANINFRVSNSTTACEP